MPRFFFLAVFLVLVGIAGGLWWYVRTDDRYPIHSVTVKIPAESSFSEAAERLDKAGVTSAPLLRLYAKFKGQESALQAGLFIFSAHETLDEVLDHLTFHPQRANVWVTIPEGYTAVQIGHSLAEAHLAGARGFAAYAHTTHTTLGKVTTPSLEGYLFPDTYLINDDAQTADIAQMMVAEFRQHLPANAEQLAHHLGYRLPQIVTIASLIEREAQAQAERPLMAGIYYHRLAIGMPLGVDASLEYTLPHHETVIHLSDVEHDTRYNTYLHRGLPPTPIANPGLLAILAALHPVRTRYLYYVYKGGGRHAFAETYQDHKANIARYLR